MRVWANISKSYQNLSNQQTEQHTRTLAATPRSSNASVDAVHQDQRMQRPARNKQQRDQGVADNISCTNCGHEHPAKRELCLAYGKQCNYCKKFNHFKNHHRSAARNKQYKSVSQIAHTNSDSNSEDSEWALTENDAKEELYCNAKVNGKTLKLKVDTGAYWNVISLDALRQVRNAEKINQSNRANLVAHGDTVINTEGTVLLECQTNDQRFYSLQFHVVTGKVQPLLGLPDFKNAPDQRLWKTKFSKQISPDRTLFKSGLMTMLSCLMMNWVHSL